jgi:hypothetical protein
MGVGVSKPIMAIFIKVNFPKNTNLKESWDVLQKEFGIAIFNKIKVLRKKNNLIKFKMGQKKAGKI